MNRRGSARHAAPGLLPGPSASSTSTLEAMLKSWMPPFFVAVVEEQVHSDRVGLNKRAVLAVTVEVLVGGGADDPRELAQQMHGLSTDETQVSDRAYLISCMFTMDFAFLIFSEMSVESTPKRRVQVTVVVVAWRWWA